MLNWLYTPIAWLLAQWHALLSTSLDPAGGAAWALAVVLLVATVRSLLLPLHLRQVRSQRAVAALQPELAELRARHAGDRQQLTQAVAALQRERGVDPLAGCLPALLQLPVFLALLHVLRRLTPTAEGLYSWTGELTHQAATATLAGAPLSDSFTVAAAGTATQVVAGVLVVAVSALTSLTQRLAQRRAAPAEGPAATVQWLLLVGMPAGLLVTGLFFPVGVLLYWTTSNLWTLVQQALTGRMAVPPVPAAGPGAAR